MAEHSNVAIVRNAYESFVKGDLDGALADKADDFVFHFGGDGPNSGDHKGREAIAAALVKNFELTAGAWALDIKSIFADDNHAARGGDRQANAALYIIVISRLRWDPATKNYMQRRLAEGKTRKEVIRCLKRYVARHAHRAILTDLANPDIVSIQLAKAA